MLAGSAWTPPAVSAGSASLSARAAPSTSPSSSNRPASSCQSASVHTTFCSCCWRWARSSSRSVWSLVSVASGASSRERMPDLSSAAASGAAAFGGSGSISSSVARS